MKIKVAKVGGLYSTDLLPGKFFNSKQDLIKAAKVKIALLPFGPEPIQRFTKLLIIHKNLGEEIHKLQQTQATDEEKLERLEQELSEVISKTIDALSAINYGPNAGEETTM